MTPNLDLSMLLDAFDGNHANVSLVPNAALGSIEADARRIEDAAAARDVKLLADAAHRIKGTSGTIRAGRLFEIVATIEHDARTPDGSVAPELVTKMREAAVALQREIASYNADPLSVGGARAS